MGELSILPVILTDSVIKILNDSHIYKRLNFCKTTISIFQSVAIRKYNVRSAQHRLNVPFKCQFLRQCLSITIFHGEFYSILNFLTNVSRNWIFCWRESTTQCARSRPSQTILIVLDAHTLHTFECKLKLQRTVDGGGRQKKTGRQLLSSLFHSANHVRGDRCWRSFRQTCTWICGTIIFFFG